jgi:ATP-binding protein involved in chromosome partitioning
MLGIHQRPVVVDRMIIPPVRDDLKLMSIGFFLDENAPVMWRGPMLHKALEQFLTDVHWGELDTLFVDMPPGTGDVAISLGQLLPRAEVLVVTTPQPAAAEVAERSGLVARQTGQTVIGVVENMTGDLFGSGGGDELAARLSVDGQSVPVLGRIPVSVALRVGGDTGAPVVLSHPDDPAAIAITELSEHLATHGRGLAGRSLPVHPR